MVAPVASGYRGPMTQVGAGVDLSADPGIDRTGIRELLKLTPRQRVELLRREARVLRLIPEGILAQREKAANGGRRRL